MTKYIYGSRQKKYQSLNDFLLEENIFIEMDSKECERWGIPLNLQNLIRMRGGHPSLNY